MAGGVALFQLGASLNLFEYSVCMFILIAFTFLLEGLINNIQRVVHGWDNKYYLTIFNKILGEMMVLGMISFTILALEQILELGNTPYYLELEFAHMLLFLVAICFVGQAVFLIRISTYIVRQWDIMNKAGLDAAISGCERYLRAGTEGRQIGFFELHDVKEAATLFIIKHQFLTKNKLRMDFDFVRYLEKSFVSNCVKTVHIDAFKWACVACLIWVNWLRSFIVDKIRGDNFPGGLDLGDRTTNETLSTHFSLDTRDQYPSSGLVFFLLEGAAMTVWALLMIYWCGPRAIRKLLRRAGVPSGSVEDFLGAMQLVRADADLLERYFQKNFKQLFEEMKEAQAEIGPGTGAVPSRILKQIQDVTYGTLVSVREGGVNGALVNLRQDAMAVESQLTKNAASAIKNMLETTLLASRDAKRTPATKDIVDCSIETGLAVSSSAAAEARFVVQGSVHSIARPGQAPEKMQETIPPSVATATETEAETEAEAEAETETARKSVIERKVVSSTKVIDSTVHKKKLRRLQNGLDVLLLMNIWYFSTWLSFYSQMPGLLERPVFYVLIIVPGFLTSFVLTPIVVVNFFLLKSLAVFDAELITEVIENENATLDALAELIEALETTLFRERLTLDAKFHQWAKGSGKLGMLHRTEDMLKNKNSSKTISLLELRQGLQVMGLCMSENRYKSLMRAFDADRSETIDLQEFKAVLVHQRPGGKALHSGLVDGSAFERREHKTRPDGQLEQEQSDQTRSTTTQEHPAIDPDVGSNITQTGDRIFL